VSTPSIFGIGILVAGVRNLIDGNFIDGGEKGIVTLASGANTLVRNVAGNQLIDEYDFDPEDTAGPQQDSGTGLSNPWANIAY
jgi:hypothetical protein